MGAHWTWGMGVLRLLLAASVVLGHAGPAFGYFLFPAQFSVTVFFILSGFYMSLVVNEKYGPLAGGTAIFYEARLLRLYPIYLVVLIASIAAQNLLHMPNVFFRPDASLEWWQRAFYIVLNFTVIGQDIVSSFDPTFHQFQNHPVSIAWTIGTEAQFYLLAPFIVKRETWKAALVLATASLAIRIGLGGLPSDPWRYRLLPSVLVFFLIGCAAYHVSAAISESKWRASARSIGRILFWGGLAGIVVLTAINGYAVPSRSDLDASLYWLAYVGVAVAIAFLHAYTGRSRLDQFIGQITYPVYIAHNLVVVLTATVIARDVIWFSPAALCGALICGLVLNRLIEKPIDLYRASLVSRVPAAPSNGLAVFLSLLGVGRGGATAALKRAPASSSRH
jgi:peptidoglycan/LPS O-acetylase OafA/YrhL